MSDEPKGDNADTWYFRRRWDGFRVGQAQVLLRFGGATARARLYDEGAPIISRWVLASLPLVVPVVHVAWSGDMVMSAKPFQGGPTEAENAVRLPWPGDLTWDPKFGEICFAYGTAEARLPSGENQLVVFGHVEDGLESLAAYCRARRFEGLGEIRVEAL
jgi:hypothetical protein